jgi:hypothetical protein
MMLTRAQAAVLEALADERIGELQGAGSPEDVAALTAEGLLGERADSRVADALAPFTTERPIEWATRTLRQGEILAAFARHCEHELGDVDVLEAAPARLALRWRRETSTLELRAGLLAFERLASETPTMLLADLDEVELDAVAEGFAADPALRGSLAIYDLGRLEKLGAVRSSVFVYFEWFLRDEYGVKLLPSAAFTQGLISRGVISLGFG